MYTAEHGISVAVKIIEVKFFFFFPPDIFTYYVHWSIIFLTVQLNSVTCVNLNGCTIL